MRETNIAALTQCIVRLSRKSLAKKEASIQLSLPAAPASFLWHDGSLEALVHRIARKASLEVSPKRTIRIKVCQKTKMRSLENFFQIRPERWVELSISWCGPAAGFEIDIREMIANLGYRCEEWIGANESWPQLGAFSFGTKRLLKLLFWVQRQKNVQRCDLLIPVANLESGKTNPPAYQRP